MSTRGSSVASWVLSRPCPIRGSLEEGARTIAGVQLLYFTRKKGTVACPENFIWPPSTSPRPSVEQIGYNHPAISSGVPEGTDETVVMDLRTPAPSKNRFAAKTTKAFIQAKRQESKSSNSSKREDSKESGRSSNISQEAARYYLRLRNYLRLSAELEAARNAAADAARAAAVAS